MSILSKTRSLWTWASQGPTRLPGHVAIHPGHVLDETPMEPFKADQHYFQVRVDEMYLSNQRKWFVQVHPTVLVISEFVYDGKPQGVPFVVGPSIVEKYGQALPHGMVFTDTRVAGLHPYRGGRLSLAVVLSEVPGVNLARELLNVVESASSLGLNAAMGTYLRVADVILDGLQALLGLNGANPIVGCRTEFDPDAGTEVVPTHYALTEDEVDPSTLWVRNGRLMRGSAPGSIEPLRACDFVLYSLRQDAERSDVETLPFGGLWERVQEESTRSTKLDDDPNWQSAKADMLSLYQSIMLSPDLTKPQKETLTDEYLVRMEALRKHAQKIAAMAGEEATDSERAQDEIRAKAVSILMG